MREGFVPLTQWLAAADGPVEPARVEEPPAQREEHHAECEPAPDAIDAALADVRRFRAALADALELAVDDLLRDVASDVLARELLLAPADLAAIVRRARERFALDEPLTIRAHPDDCPLLCGESAAVIPDPQLRRGDVVIDVRSGTIDARLGVRLESLLARRTAP